ncbi:uncharacterized protein TRIADDRAFT_33034, partial [Trichoplax adhaerens]
YRYSDDAIKDTLTVLRTFQNFRLDLSKYTYNDGRESSLFCMDGTIPVVYKGTTYNIPICIYLEKNYPHQSPICFVRPTNYMILKQTKIVNADGKVSISYLLDWRYPQSDLTTFLQVLCLQFADEMPVYSKKATSYPSQTSQPGYSSSLQSSYPRYSNPRQPYPPPNVNPNANLPYPPTSSYGMPQPGNPSPYPPASSTASISYPSFPSPRLGDINPSNEQVMYQSLLTSVEEKLKRRLNEALEEGKTEIESQMHIENELKKSSTILEDKLKRLKEEEDQVRAEIDTMSTKLSELHQIESRVGTDPSKLNIDDAIITTAPLYTQILNLHTEECAIEDTIYYLGEALRREVIDLEIFLKHVRSLSRRQFMLKALIRKARATAGLP